MKISHRVDFPLWSRLGQFLPRSPKSSEGFYAIFFWGTCTTVCYCSCSGNLFVWQPRSTFWRSNKFNILFTVTSSLDSNVTISHFFTWKCYSFSTFLNIHYGSASVFEFEQSICFSWNLFMYHMNLVFHHRWRDLVRNYYIILLLFYWLRVFGPAYANLN